MAGVATAVLLTEPLDYADFVRLLRRADLVLTDSGGIQEEACSLGIPTLVARDTTERPEGAEAGGLLLVGTEPPRSARRPTGCYSTPRRTTRWSAPAARSATATPPPAIVDALAIAPPLPADLIEHSEPREGPS